MRLEKIIWIRSDIAESHDDRKNIVTCALENNFIDIIVREDDKETFEKLGKFNAILVKDGKIRVDGREGEFISIEGKEDEEKALSLAEKTDYVYVSTKNWMVIPVENLIAAYQNSNTKLLVEVKDSDDMRLFFETLEVGVDGVVLNSTDKQNIFDLRKLADELMINTLELVSARITKIKSLGTGDRVCVDTCSILNVGEGMLIGSQSNGLFLVHSESVESEYVDTRPFRVNAGPVHSYILASSDKTRYLSDLKAGDEILAVNRKGSTRSVILGRVKVEKRPLILVEARYENKSFNIILQNAETIRLVSEGKPKSIVDLKEGDSILIWIDDKGRHFGMKVDESIIEK
ncbi:MAG: 3-dehydroquinate synthase II [Methanomassiliicoccales archaeon]|nr:MAG: 3-dehydroquinate synthase II [Methanomassiliicoccales archaeon]